MSTKQSMKIGKETLDLRDEIERHFSNAHIVATLMMQEDQYSEWPHEMVSSAAWLIQGEIEAAKAKFIRLQSLSARSR